jgi:hypothetical protein
VITVTRRYERCGTGVGARTLRILKQAEENLPPRLIGDQILSSLGF